MSAHNNTNARRIERDVESGRVAAEISVKDVGVAPTMSLRPPMPAPSSMIGNPAPLGLLAFGVTTSEFLREERASS